MKRKVPYKILEDEIGYQYFVIGLPFTAAIPKELIDDGSVTIGERMILFDYSREDPILVEDYFRQSLDKEVVLYQCCAIITFYYSKMEHIRDEALLSEVLFYKRIKPLNERALSNFLWRVRFDTNYRISPEPELCICPGEPEVEAYLDLEELSPLGEVTRGVIKAELGKIGFWDLLLTILGPQNVYRCSIEEIETFNLIQYSKNYAIRNSIQVIQEF